MSKKLLIIVLLGASILTHFIFFGYPNQTVFDEVHFGKFVSGYYTHQYFFDIHPPLGKLLIAGFGKIFNFHPEYSFAQIGETFPDKGYYSLRFLPDLAGMLLPFIIFLLALELGFSKTASFLAGAFVILENALLVQSRFILMDAFLLLFGFTSLLFYLRHRNKHNGSEKPTTLSQPKGWKYLIGMAVFGAFAVSVKWTGLAFLGLAGVIEFIDVVKRPAGKKILNLILFFVVIPATIYFSVFAVHFGLLTKSGPGDGFMTPEFQKTLQGNPFQNDSSLKTPTIFGKFLELNAEMYKANQTLTAEHPYSSKWYTWPFMKRPIFYWVNGESKIYLLGNPVIWWGSTAAVLLLISYMITGQLRKDRTGYILLGGYLANLLPFIGIGRVMFLYHYLSALVFAILILAYLIDKNKHKKEIFTVLLVVSAILFIYFSPLTYGLPLSQSNYQQHLWLPSWQ